MSLLKILSKYKKEDAEQMEKESLFSKDIQVGLSPVEIWELEKQKEEPKDFFSFHKEMSAQSIKINENT